MSVQTPVADTTTAHEHLFAFAYRASTYFFVAGLVVFLAWLILLASLLFDMRENPSQFFGAGFNPRFVDYVRVVITYGSTYPAIVTLLAMAGTAARLFAHGHAAKLERHDELLDVLEGRLGGSNAEVEED